MGHSSGSQLSRVRHPDQARPAEQGWHVPARGLEHDLDARLACSRAIASRPERASGPPLDGRELHGLFRKQWLSTGKRVSFLALARAQPFERSFVIGFDNARDELMPDNV